MWSKASRASLTPIAWPRTMNDTRWFGAIFCEMCQTGLLFLLVDELDTLVDLLRASESSYLLQFNLGVRVIIPHMRESMRFFVCNWHNYKQCWSKSGKAYRNIYRFNFVLYAFVLCPCVWQWNKLNLNLALKRHGQLISPRGGHEFPIRHNQNYL